MNLAKCIQILFYRIISIVSLIFLVLPNGEIKNNRFDVIFYDYDSITVLATRGDIEKGGMAVPPNDPVRNGYVFSEWVGNYTNVTADQKVIAKYISSSSPNILKVSNTSGSNAEMVEITLDLIGKVNVCGFDLILSYDSSYLTFQGMEEGKGVSCNRNGNYVLISYLNPLCVNETSERTIVTVTFLINSTTSRIIPVTVFSDGIFDENGDDVNYTIINGSVIVV